MTDKLREEKQIKEDILVLRRRLEYLHSEGYNKGFLGVFYRIEGYLNDYILPHAQQSQSPEKEKKVREILEKLYQEGLLDGEDNPERIANLNKVTEALSAILALGVEGC